MRFRKKRFCPRIAGKCLGYMCKIERIGRIRRAGRLGFAALEIKTAKCALKNGESTEKQRRQAVCLKIPV